MRCLPTGSATSTQLARCPNVVAKLGGLAMPVNGFGWHKREPKPTSQQLAEATARYYLHTIERFGPERCMFESNFPVDKVSCSYLVLWNSFKRLAAGFSASEKAALFHDTAARVYRLDRLKNENGGQARLARASMSRLKPTQRTLAQALSKTSRAQSWQLPQDEATRVWSCSISKQCVPVRHFTPDVAVGDAVAEADDHGAQQGLEAACCAVYME